MPGARRVLRRRSPPRPRAAALTRSPLFSQEVLEDLQVERLIRDDALQPPVLVFEGAQSLGLVDLQPAVLAAPFVKRLPRDPVAPNQLSGLRAGCALLQDGDDLFFRESTLAHRSSAVRIGKNNWIRIRGSRHRAISASSGNS